jgi:uncharacterized lipoprotein YddW (UPF0748 family)
MTQTKDKMKAIFGVSREQAPFKGKKESEIADILKSFGVNAVFGVHEDRALATALQHSGIKVYAELALFSGPDRWKDHPEARPVTAEGKPIEKDKWYGGLCPNQEWLRKEKLDLLRKLAGEYRVDGVWLDYIRYSCHWEVPEPRIEQNCFCPVCMDLFQKSSGLRIPDEAGDAGGKAKWILSKHKDEWTKFKCGRIDAFVEESRRILKEANPDAVLGIFGVPWLESEHQDAIREVIAQDYKSLGKLVDVISPMCYHRMCGKDVEWIRTVSSEISRISGKPCAPIIQAAEVPADEFRRALNAASADPLTGVIVFNMRGMLKENHLETFRGFCSGSN